MSVTIKERKPATLKDQISSLDQKLRAYAAYVEEKVVLLRGIKLDFSDVQVELLKINFTAKNRKVFDQWRSQIYQHLLEGLASDIECSLDASLGTNSGGIIWG